ncbi:hypothetical protein AHiyo4_35140 [Arthrobacter sp. Hiyo4]|nr:hypothetical protein AHiyo4_35140 [Arthrobacter sp. Hiyo4]
MWKTALKPRWIAGLVFAIVVSGVFVLLSQWQFGRSTQPEAAVNPATEDVRALTETLEPGVFFPGSVSDQMVSADGTYDPAKQVLVPGRLKNGENGYWVVSAFAVYGAPTLTGTAASPQTWIPVARGWVADPDDAGAPPSGVVNLTGRLLPSESPLPSTAPEPGRASAVSVAELINYWDLSMYPGFVAAASELAAGSDLSAAAVDGALKPLEIGPSRPRSRSTGSISSTRSNGWCSPASPCLSGGAWSRTTTGGTSKRNTTKTMTFRLHRPPRQLLNSSNKR